LALLRSQVAAEEELELVERDHIPRLCKSGWTAPGMTISSFGAADERQSAGGRSE
jgi:hypothetical protein